VLLLATIGHQTQPTIKPTIKLPQSFYARSARAVAQALLGKRLIRLVNGERVGGLIVETEAYCDSAEPDLACHASRNKGRPTPRTAVMFGSPGYAFVYFTYGMHWMFNVVTGDPGLANGVLIRAIEPIEGEHIMALNRGDQPRPLWTNGPAKLTAALAIDKQFNGANLFSADGVIWIENGIDINPESIANGPRVGMGKTPEPWFSIPWRYWIQDNPFVSKYR
jgi:DNA-3-methyladenine glycosylase